MFVVDKVVEEDKLSDAVLSPLQQIDLPDGTSVSLGPSACDAYAVFEDLCLLANSEKPQYLKLESLPKTFALELIESVVTNYHELFRKVRLSGTRDRLSNSNAFRPASGAPFAPSASSQSPSSQDHVGPRHFSTDASFDKSCISLTEAIWWRARHRRRGLLHAFGQDYWR
jgi:hypothetical protein